jgi:hypothetical protein
MYAGSLDQPSTQPPLTTPAIVHTDATGSRVSTEQGVSTLISHVFRRLLERGYSQEKKKLPLDCGCACPGKPWVLCIDGPVPVLYLCGIPW